ncbi:hypothetical protein AQ487_16800 [Enterococcus faecalis]|nr:hypothetical protein AQ487_16800 [Enterococcus faecalis]
MKRVMWFRRDLRLQDNKALAGMALKKLRRTMAVSTKCLRPITINGKRRLKKPRFLFPIQLKKFLVRVFFQKRKQLIVNRLRGFL